MSAKQVFLIHGNDEYLVSNKAKTLLLELIPGVDDASTQLERIDGAADKVEGALHAVNQTLMALNAMGLFSEAKTVWLENASFFADNRTGQSDSVQTQIGRLTDRIKAGLPSGVNLIITATGMDKRRGFYKACKTHAELHEFMVADDKNKGGAAALNERLSEFLEARGLSMTPAARHAFLQKVGPDSRLLLSEVEKLKVALGKRSKIEIGDISEYVSASREAAFWDLADAFAERDLPRALQTLRQLVFQRQNIIGLMFNLEKRVRELLIYREALDQKWLLPTRNHYGRASWTWGELPPDIENIYASNLDSDPRKIHPYRVGIIAAQAAKFTRKRLEYCLKQVVMAHENMVSSRIPPELTMELLLVRMLGSARRPARKQG